MIKHTIGILAAVTLACGGGQSVGQGTTTAQATDQVSMGKQLYVQNCAGCHGNAGQGTEKGPPVVGKSALPLDPPPNAQVRKAQFHTAKDVFDFVKQYMPKDKPGSLTDEEYAEILAFDLSANGVDMSHTNVNMTSAPTIVLHP